MSDPRQVSFSSWRHAGASLLTSMQGYSTLLLTGAMGSLSATQREALQSICDNCAPPRESWQAVHELIHHEQPDEVIRILSQVDHNGQSYLKMQIVDKALAALTNIQKEITFLRTRAEQLTAEQHQMVEIINTSCEREIRLWQEVIAYFDYDG